MPKFFAQTKDIRNNKIIIKNDYNHIKNVLRKKIGDKLTICNSENEKEYFTIIEEIREDSIVCNIIEEVDNNVESNINITIFQGLPKSDKMELIIQKCVEIGVKRFVPVNMERAIVKLTNNDIIKKCERWNKIAEVASKQSGRNLIPQVKKVVNYNEFINLAKDLDLLIVCYEEEKNLTLKQTLKDIKNNFNELNIGVLIGPEGGITPKEIELIKQNENTKIVTIGKRILRTETVALVVSGIILYELESK